MDLSVINETLKDSTILEITHPITGEGGWEVELASPCHASAQSKVMAILDKARKRKGSTPAQEEKDGVELICARILGWEGLKSGETEVPYAPETAAKILSDPKSFWIRSQILEALGDPSRPFNG